MLHARTILLAEGLSRRAGYVCPCSRDTQHRKQETEYNSAHIVAPLAGDVAVLPDSAGGLSSNTARISAGMEERWL
jgi:hypothetical protein